MRKLHLQAERGSLSALDEYLTDGGSPDLHSTGMRDTLLHVFARKGESYGVRHLLDAGARVNVTNRLGETPLMLAAKARARVSLKLLLDARANPSLTDTEGRTVMHYAIGDAGCVLLLHHAGVPIDTADSGGRTPLLRAAWEDQPGGLFALLKLGANVNAQDSSGSSALMACVKHEDETGTRLLLEGSVDLALKDNTGRTAEDYAKECENEAFQKIFEALVAKQPRRQP